jgi:hypothetical protein
MSGSMLFHANSKEVVYDVVEDEVIIVHLKSGCYYSLDRVGAQIWGCLERGMDLTETIRAITTTYDASEAEIADVIEQLVTELENENLLVAVAPENEQAVTPHAASSSEPVAQTEKKHFVAPSLHKYTDMQELLLIDPIHDVDDYGWPVIKKENP